MMAMDDHPTLKLRVPAALRLPEEPVPLPGYRLVRTIGRGGFGTVYEVERHGDRLALKVLNVDMATSDGVRRFLREIEALRRLQHDNVIRLVESGELRDGRPYLVTELLHGLDLETRLQARGSLPPGEARSILLPVCSALAFCHARGIIHRDVKPSNIFLGTDDRVVLLDFGIAKLIDAQPVGESEVRVVGTPSCTSPEQLTGGWVDERTDVYLLGCTLYQMLTGIPPYADHPPGMRRALHLSAPRPRPSARASVPPGVDLVVTTAMSISPAARYGGPRQLARALDAALGADAAGAGEEIDALGILVETSATATSDASLAAAERALERAGELLLAAGFIPALRAGNLLIYVGRLGPQPGDSVETARAALARLGERERGSLSVRMRLGKVVMSEGEVRAGALVDPATWWE